MRRKQALPISRVDRGNRNIATIVTCMLVPLAIPTFVWIALIAGLPFMLGIGTLYFAASSMWFWYHIFQLHRPAKYCVNEYAIEQRAETGVSTVTVNLLLPSLIASSQRG